MKVLFIHPNMPGQYKHLARILGSHPDNQVLFLTKRNDVSIPGVTRVEYKVSRKPASEIHRYIIGFEKAVLHGQEIWRVCKKLKAAGFTPDVICAHPGWGDALFIKDIYPNSRLLSFFEFYYHAFGADVHFSPEEKVIDDELARIRVKNATNLLSLESADWGITPTFWQLKQHPKEFWHKISVVHDSIDTNVVAPCHFKQLVLADGTELKPSDEIITYVCRNFEPYRGFPTVMRAIKLLTEQRPHCHVLVVGNDDVSYGRRPEGNKTYKQIMIEETKPDLSRVHFINGLPYDHYLRVLQISSAHIYFTVPFVLSWSALEAMSAGCVVVGSDTAPVTEVIKDGVNGLLTDFFSPEKLASRLIEVLDHPTRMQHIREAARQTIIDKYSITQLMPLHLSLIHDLANGQVPPPAAETIKSFNNIHFSDVMTRLLNESTNVQETKDQNSKAESSSYTEATA